VLDGENAIKQLRSSGQIRSVSATAQPEPQLCWLAVGREGLKMVSPFDLIILHCIFPQIECGHYFLNFYLIITYLHMY